MLQAIWLVTLAFNLTGKCKVMGFISTVRLEMQLCNMSPNVITTYNTSVTLSHDLASYQDIVPWDIAVKIPTMQWSVICCHEHFVVVSDINDDIMTTPAAINWHDDVTELPVTSQLFGMLWHHKYALIWCDVYEWVIIYTYVYMWCDYYKKK